MVSREYSAEEVWSRLQGGVPFFLVDTLPPSSYRHRHLPGALNLPVEEVSARAPELLPDRDAEIVTYCSGPT